MRIFVDSDVVISSLLSHTGAAYLLLYDKNITKIISRTSDKELRAVCIRLKISVESLEHLERDCCRIIPAQTAVKAFMRCVTDPGDAHVISGAVAGRAQYIISYNIRHYNIDAIKEDYGIIVLTPAMLLQFLRNH